MLRRLRNSPGKEEKWHGGGLIPAAVAGANWLFGSKNRSGLTNIWDTLSWWGQSPSERAWRTGEMHTPEWAMQTMGMPNPNAPMYNLGQYPTDWVKQGERGIQQQASQATEQMLNAINQQAATRGLLNTSYGMEKGREAAEIVARNSAQALANLYGQAAQMQQQGQMAGMGMYNQAYQTWLANMNKAQDDWINNLMGMINLIPGMKIPGAGG